MSKFKDTLSGRVIELLDPVISDGDYWCDRNGVRIVRIFWKPVVEDNPDMLYGSLEEIRKGDSLDGTLQPLLTVQEARELADTYEKPYNVSVGYDMDGDLCVAVQGETCGIRYLVDLDRSYDAHSALNRSVVVEGVSVD